MTVEQSRERVKSSIWQSIAQSGVKIDAVPTDQLDVLVNAITDGVLVAVDDLLEDSGMAGRQDSAFAPLADEEVVLWEGRPFLSLVIALPHHQRTGTHRERLSGQGSRRHRTDPHPGHRPQPGIDRARAEHRRHQTRQRRPVQTRGRAAQCQGPGRGPRDPAARHAGRPQALSATAYRKRCDRAGRLREPGRLAAGGRARVLLGPGSGRGPSPAAGTVAAAARGAGTLRGCRRALRPRCGCRWHVPSAAQSRLAVHHGADRDQRRADPGERARFCCCPITRAGWMCSWRCRFCRATTSRSSSVRFRSCATCRRPDRTSFPLGVRLAVECSRCARVSTT